MNSYWLTQKVKILLIFWIVIWTNFHVFPQTYKLIGPPGGIVSQNNIAIHPNDPTLIYTSTYAGGVFRSELLQNIISPIEAEFDFSANSQIALPYNELKYIYIDLFGYSLKSTNSGEDWEIIYEQNSQSHFSFNPLNSDIMFMVRDNYEIWRSNDKGNTWFILKIFNKPVRQITVAPTDTSFIYVAVDFEFYKSTNSGVDWVITSTSPGQVYRIIVNPYNKNSVYYHTNGSLLKSEDGGYSLRTLYNSDVNDFVLNSFDTLKLYVTAIHPFNPLSSGIFRTADGGNNWYRMIDGIPGENIASNSISIDPYTPDVLFAGIGDLGVYKTTDGGNNWFLTKLAYSRVNNIYVDPENPGLIISSQYGFGIMETDDDGNNWIQPQFDIPFEDLECNDITFNPDDISIGFAAGGLSLLKTTDGSQSWFTTNQLAGVKSVSYHPKNSNILFAGGQVDQLSPVFFVKSTDGGNSWNSVMNNFRPDYFVFHPTDTNIIYTAGFYDQTFNYGVLKSTDLGETWIPKNTGLVHSNETGLLEYITSISILESDPEVLYCSQLKSLSKSTNGGNNWFQIDSSLKVLEPDIRPSSVLIDNNRTGRIYVGSSKYSENFGGLYLTEDDGQQWQKVYNDWVNVIKADNSIPRNIYFGTRFGIMKITDTITVSVEETTSEVPNQFNLFQNHPNPFNPFTTIRFQIPQSGFVTLKVYDILGKEIATLVNEEKHTGRYEVKFDASDLASGVYIYKIQVNDYVSPKKMILLK